MELKRKNHKIAHNQKELLDLIEDDSIESSGRIHISNTDLCMSVRCICGEIGHVDGENVRYVRCGYCGKTYYHPHRKTPSL